MKKIKLIAKPYPAAKNKPCTATEDTVYQIGKIDFEMMIEELEQKYPTSIGYLKEIYRNRHGISTTLSPVTLDEQVMFANEFFIKFGKPILDPMAADIQSLQGRNLVKETIEKVCQEIENDLL